MPLCPIALSSPRIFWERRGLGEVRAISISSTPSLVLSLRAWRFSGRGNLLHRQRGDCLTSFGESFHFIHAFKMMLFVERLKIIKCNQISKTGCIN
jgi:hypothetical protein